MRPRPAPSLDRVWATEQQFIALHSAVASDEVVVLAGIESGDSYVVLALDRESGVALWEQRAGGWPVAELTLIGDTLLVDRFVGGSQGLLYAISVRTGEELWRDDQISRRFNGEPPSPFLVRHPLEADRDYKRIDVTSGREVGRFTPAGTSPNAWVAETGTGVVELDPDTLEPLRPVIPFDRPVSDFPILTVLADRVVTADDDGLTARDRVGVRIARLSLEPLGLYPRIRSFAGLEGVFFVDYQSSQVGFDELTLDPLWSLDASSLVDVGPIDEEVHGLATWPDRSELVSLKSGESRCVLEGAVDPVVLRGGIFDSGRLYDLDCVVRRSIGTSEGHQSFEVVDQGVIESQRIDGGILVAFHQ